MKFFLDKHNKIILKKQNQQARLRNTVTANNARTAQLTGNASQKPYA